MIQDDPESARARVEVLEAEVAALRLELATERGKQCGTCRHWYPEGQPGWERSCENVKTACVARTISKRAHVLDAEDYGGGWLMCDADFGCVEWEAKDE